MDIAALSMNMAAVENMGQVGIALLDKAMETNEALGQGMVQILDSAAMERSVNPHVGGNIDMRI